MGCAARTCFEESDASKANRLSRWTVISFTVNSKHQVAVRHTLLYVMRSVSRFPNLEPMALDITLIKALGSTRCMPELGLNQRP